MLMDINDLWDEHIAAVTMPVHELPVGDDRPDVCQHGRRTHRTVREICESSNAAASLSCGQKMGVQSQENYKDRDVSVMHVASNEWDVVHSAIAGTKSSTSHPCAASNSCDHVVTPNTVAELPSQERRREHRDTHHGTDGQHEDRFWKGQDEPNLRGSFPRSGVDQFHGVSLRTQRQVCPSKIPEVCEAANPDWTEHTSEVQEHQEGREPGSAKEQQHVREDGITCGRGRGVRMGTDVRSSGSQGGGESSQSHGGSSGPSDFSSPTPFNTRSSDPAQGRESVDQLSEHEASANTEHAMFVAKYHDGKFDYDHSGDNTCKNYSRECQRLVNQIRKELRDVQQVIRPTKHRVTLFEVMCSDDSELTRQCQQLGCAARRFSLNTGDLSTVKARRQLFSHLISEAPEHLWYSPECGPWCRWSSFNMARSAEGLAKVLEARWQCLWQVALGVVLFEHQVSTNRHVHLEQPDGSAMLKLPCLGKVVQVALPCVFDMCVVGGLIDPTTKMAIRKRLVVCTTSQEMRSLLDQRKMPGRTSTFSHCWFHSSRQSKCESFQIHGTVSSQVCSPDW